MTPSVFVVPPRWRVLLIEGEPVKVHSSKPPFPITVHRLYWYFLYSELVGWFLVLTVLCIKSIQSRPGPSAQCLPGNWQSLWSQAKSRSSAAEKSPEDSARFFLHLQILYVANMLTINDPKPDIWTPSVQIASKDLTDSWSNSGPL